MLKYLKKLITARKIDVNEEQGIKIYASRCLRLQQKDLICHNCVKSCPNEAIDLRRSLKFTHHKCNGCGICIEVCPSGVFSFQHTGDETDISRREFFNRFRI